MSSSSNGGTPPRKRRPGEPWRPPASWREERRPRSRPMFSGPVPGHLDPPPGLDAVFVEPFMGGSHAAFARGWIERSRHRWRVISLPGERWKWRMRAAAMALAPRLAALDPPPAAVVVSGLLDLAHLRQLTAAAGAPNAAATAAATAAAPHLLYLHENQLSYPRPPREPLDRGFAVAHVASLLAADRVAFNSRAHRDAMRAELRAFLDEVPPPRPRGVMSRVSPKQARILPPGVDLTGFPAPAARAPGDPPVIAWNHRWEEDKRPSAFARILLDLAERRGLDFRLILLGPVDQVHPRPLELIRERLGARILRDGPARTRREYVRWLARADIAVSVAAQENFGYAAVEAMAAGAVPLLPNRLSYPELLTPALRRELLYDTDRHLRDRLAAWLRDPAPLAALRPRVMRSARRHAWEPRAEALDEWIAAAAAAARP